MYHMEMVDEVYDLGTSGRFGEIRMTGGPRTWCFILDGLVPFSAGSTVVQVMCAVVREPYCG